MQFAINRYSQLKPNLRYYNSTYIVQGEGIVEAAILKETKDTNLIIFITVPSILKMVPNLEGERERQNKIERRRREAGKSYYYNERGEKWRGEEREREEYPSTV